MALHLGGKRSSSIIFHKISKILVPQLSASISSRPAIKIVSHPANPEKYLVKKTYVHGTYDLDNMKLGRPMSPHLTIYKPQITSMLSITHRATGMILSSYAVALAFGALILPHGVPYYIEGLQCAKVGGFFIYSMKFWMAFPMSYHFWAGLRHLIFDTGAYLTIQGVYTTGYILMATVILSTMFLCSLGKKADDEICNEPYSTHQPSD